MSSPNPFVYNPPPLVLAGTTLPTFDFSMAIGICSAGAIASEPGTPLGSPLGFGVQDFQTGTFINTFVGMHWTGTCYTGFASFYLEPTTGALVNVAGFWDTSGNFVGAQPGRSSLFADIPNVRHIGIGININFNGPFPICAVRICEFDVRQHGRVINSSKVCYPSWAYVLEETFHLFQPWTVPGPPTGLPPTILPASGPRPPYFWPNSGFGSYVAALYAYDIFFDQGNYLWRGQWQQVNISDTVVLGFDSNNNPIHPPPYYWYQPVLELVDFNLYSQLGILEGFFFPTNSWTPGLLLGAGDAILLVNGQKVRYQTAIFFLAGWYFDPAWPPDALAAGPAPNAYQQGTITGGPAPYVEVDVVDHVLYGFAALWAGQNNGGGAYRYRLDTPANLGFRSTEHTTAGVCGNFVYNTINMQPDNYNLYIYNLATAGQYALAPKG